MLHQFLISIKNFMDPKIFFTIIIISLFEFFVDRPALKKQGFIKDAKVASIMSIAGVASAIAMAFVARLVK